MRGRACSIATCLVSASSEGGTPPRFGIFERGRAVLFVDSWHGGPPEVSGGWHAYLHVTGLEALRDDFVAAGAEISRPIEHTVYDMREFEVTDPDGYVICFGEDPQDRN